MNINQSCHQLFKTSIWQPQVALALIGALSMVTGCSYPACRNLEDVHLGESETFISRSKIFSKDPNCVSSTRTQYLSKILSSKNLQYIVLCSSGVVSAIQMIAVGKPLSRYDAMQIINSTLQTNALAISESDDWETKQIETDCPTEFLYFGRSGRVTITYARIRPDESTESIAVKQIGIDSN